MIVRILLLFIALFTFGAQAQAIKESYAFAVLGEPRYAFNFNHFDYVNPAAPKGGQITLSALGTFDNFNRYALRGNPGARTEQLYDTLFTTSDDEPGSYYPLIAESARYADDYSWVEVAINPLARFHDGSPITARDVEFTFQKFMTEGVPQFRLVYKGTTVKAIAPLTVRIELAKPGRVCFRCRCFQKSTGRITNLATRSPRLRLPVVRTELRLGKWGKILSIPA